MFKSCSSRTVPAKDSYCKISQGQKHCSPESARSKKDWWWSSSGNEPCRKFMTPFIALE